MRPALLALSLAALAWLLRREEGTWTVGVSHYRPRAYDPEPAEPMDGIQPADPVTTWTCDNGHLHPRGTACHGHPLTTQSGPVGPSA